MCSSGAYARLVGVSVWTIRRWAKKGYGPAPRIVGNRMRWNEAEIRAFFALPRLPDKAVGVWGDVRNREEGA